MDKKLLDVDITLTLRDAEKTQITTTEKIDSFVFDNKTQSLKIVLSSGYTVLKSLVQCNESSEVALVYRFIAKLLLEN